jgi:ketosteroid isomerase-like protein
MSDNVDALKRGYDAFNNGDAETLAGVFAEDVRWEGTNDDRVPGAGTFEGRDDVLTALGRAVEPFESFTSSPDEFIEDGDTVVVLGHSEGRTKSGNDLKVPYAHVWRMSGGTIERGQLLTDTAMVLKALEG